MVVAGTMVLALLGAGALHAASSGAPFKGGGAGSINGQDVLGPTLVHLTASASGNATHLGQFTRTESLYLNPATGSFTGTITFTSADGDNVSCDVDGQFISASDAIGNYTITGGTGRFGQASGHATFSASMTSATNFRVSFQGDITW